jgi:DNA-binding transcriptional MerR regulator
MSQPDRQPQHPIGIVAQRTGLSPHVLRAWERRYGVVEPSRPHGGPRLYSNADILHFRLLRRLTKGGHSIGRIAQLSMPELLALLPQDETASDRPSLYADQHVAEVLTALEGMDAAGVRAALMRGVVALSAEGFIEGVALPLLRRVGELWADGSVCPAHEHLLSVQLSRVLGWLADTIPVSAGAPVAVAATPRGQRHEFGALLASVVAAEEGWAVTYLGPDLPADDLATAVRLRRASVLLLSTVMPDHSAAAELRRIAEAVGAGVQVYAGGRGAGTAAGGPANLRWLEDLQALRRVLRERSERGGTP